MTSYKSLFADDSDDDLEAEIMLSSLPFDGDFAAKKAAYKYNRRACKAALRGLAIPDSLYHVKHRCSVVRGIRYHPGFAESLRGVDALYTRALNARSIMSNKVPKIASLEELPYCIWHPEVATEETYRELVAQCPLPEVKYLVGRACAVAGYVDLFKELDILPEIHIAAEARDNNHEIVFDYIMSQPILFEVMNDYTRQIDVKHPRAGAVLDGNTAVCSYLNQRRKLPSWCLLSDYDDTFWLDRKGNFNITEDWSFDLRKSRTPDPGDPEPLLIAPLPTHLPPVDKDLLICLAAYNGDLDRYSRLRRPHMVRLELECVIRGIYHNTFFAIWWASQVNQKTDREIFDAIAARYVMNGELTQIEKLSRIKTCPCRPEMIWYPEVASTRTYVSLVEKYPEMWESVARALMVSLDPSAQAAFEKLDPEPTLLLVYEAAASPNPFFKHFFDKKIALLSSDEQAKLDFTNPWVYSQNYPATLAKLNFRELGNYPGAYFGYKKDRVKDLRLSNIRYAYDPSDEAIVDIRSVTQYLCEPPETRWGEDDDDYTYPASEEDSGRDE